MDRGSEWAFFKETQMANKHTKRVQCHLITREIKVRIPRSALDCLKIFITIFKKL